MYRLLIERKGRKPQVFQLKDAVTTIGRGKDTDLLLPDISVSRHHAQIERVKDDKYVLVDAGSQNGTKVNGKRIEKHKLESSDQIQVGKFLIVFEFKAPRHVEEGRNRNPLGDYTTNEERTGYLRKVSAVDGDDACSTTHLSPEELEEVRRLIRLVENARIEVVNQPQDSWLVGKKGLHFGKGGVPADGMGIGGAAYIRWSGKSHFVEKLGGLFLAVAVNGKRIKKATMLSPGDLVVVGKTAFRYRV
jgi:hypothetical protein